MSAREFEKVLEGKYPAKQHTGKVVDRLRAKLGHINGVLYLEGKKTKLLEDNDEPEPFRQRRQFFYLSGCKMPDCSLIHDISTGRTTLFIPPVDADSVIWSGLPISKEEALQKFDVQEVLYTTETNHMLRTAASNSGSTVFSITGQVSNDVDFSKFAERNSSVLKDAIDACRVVKSEFEVALIRKANKISTAAHLAVLEKVSHVANEQELEAIFLAKCVAAGAKEQAYHSIVASGRAAATLHYVRNDQPLAGKLNLLLDAGAEWDCYASDITRTFPLSGRFSVESRQIYEIVADMQTRCIAMLHGDIIWDSVHEMAHRIAIDGLLALGILRGNKDEIFQKRISVAFFPHGLGHYLGMDTHDTVGNANYSDPDPLFRLLRVRGPIPEGSVVTVEPGIYFCQFIIQPYLDDASRSAFIDEAVLNKYWDVGGVRLEDNILITRDGCENLTPAECVKSLAEVERS